jgi:hypothetical protein
MAARLGVAHRGRADPRVPRRQRLSGATIEGARPKGGVDVSPSSRGKQRKRPRLPVNESERLYEMDAEDAWTSHHRLVIDSSLGMIEETPQTTNQRRRRHD